MENELPVTGLYGLVVCGGNSSRMGIDKSLLSYHGKPQRQYLYEHLQQYCEKVFISCNEQQASVAGAEQQLLIDLPAYKNTGPMAALLTAFTKYPANGFLVTGCDYPFLDMQELAAFMRSLPDKNFPAAFYHQQEDLYEPLLAYYPFNSFETLKQLHAKGQYSLQSFLRKSNAVKYIPAEERTICSIDTYEDHLKAKAMLELQAGI